jgi:hypothetical protein
MEGVGLTLLGMTLIGAIGALVWRRHRGQRLQVTQHNVRCPLHDCRANVAVRTDPDARSRHQFAGITTCSLLSHAAVALPERTAYLSDFPPYKVRLEAARSYPVYAAEVSCPQHCVLVLNESSVSVVSQPVECVSGVSDAIELAAQTVRSPRISRLLWYYDH